MDGSTTDTLDPATLDDQMGMHDSCICNNIVEIDYKGNPVPELAQGWDASTNANAWTFKLRKGVEAKP